MPPNMPHKCSAPNCNQRFEQEKSLIKHKASTHSKPVKPYNCNIPSCGRRFKDRQALAQHMATPHTPQIARPSPIPQPSPSLSPASPRTPFLNQPQNIDARYGVHNSVGGSQYHINTVVVAAAEFPANLVGMPSTPPPYQWLFILCCHSHAFAQRTLNLLVEARSFPPTSQYFTTALLLVSTSEQLLRLSTPVITDHEADVNPLTELVLRKNS